MPPFIHLTIKIDATFYPFNNQNILSIRYLQEISRLLEISRNISKKASRDVWSRRERPISP